MELQQIIKFIDLIHQFQKVERVMKIRDRDNPENDVEHSYQLAMVAWYATSSYNLNLDIDKVIKYSLLHDLVEAYAGDVDAFDLSPGRDKIKAEREHQALVRLKSEFPEFPEMIKIIEEYELRENGESKFVYALDKVLPPINIYLDNGRNWKERGIGFTMEKLVTNKRIKIANQPSVEKLFEQLVEILEKNPHLFTQEKEKNEKI